MSNKKATPLQVVKRYHERYLEYENAFNNDPFDEKGVQKELEEVINSGVSFDSEEFENAVIDLMVEKPARRADVNNAASKFFYYAEFYIATQEEELPESIKKDFDTLPIKKGMKPYFSIKNGKFVKNEDAPINIQKEQLKEIYRALQKKD